MVFNHDYIDHYPAPKYVLVALNEDGTGAKDHLDAFRVCSDLNFVRRHLRSTMIRRSIEDKDEEHRKGKNDKKFYREDGPLLPHVHVRLLQERESSNHLGLPLNCVF